MPTDQQRERAGREELHELVSGLSPDRRLQERVRAVVARRRRARARTTAAVACVTAAATAVFSLGGVGTASGPQLRLASFKLGLPARAHVQSRGSRGCLPAAVLYPGTSAPTGGPADPPESRVVSAVTAAGGCVSMLLTAPYAPGSAHAPFPLMDLQAARPVAIDSYHGLVGPASWVGASGIVEGRPVSGATAQSMLDLRVPAGGGQVEDLVFAAEGLSPQQLSSIVSSGLSAPRAAS